MYVIHENDRKRIIEMWIFLKFNQQITAEVNCCHNSPELTIPITIGSIPFIDNYHRIKRRATVPSLDTKSRKPTNLFIDSKYNQKLNEPTLTLTEKKIYSVFYIPAGHPVYVEAVGIPTPKEGKKISHIPVYPTFKNA